VQEERSDGRIDPLRGWTPGGPPRRYPDAMRGNAPIALGFEPSTDELPKDLVEGLRALGYGD
jgi:hypothetical protein